MQHVFSGLASERRHGYARATVVDGWVFVSATAGVDLETGKAPESLEDQVEQMFANLTRALADAGCTLHDTVRREIFVSEPAYGAPVLKACRDHGGETWTPATTATVVGFLSSDIKVEMSVTAKVGAAA